MGSAIVKRGGMIPHTYRSLMSIYSGIETKWGFSLPAGYRVLADCGAMDYEHPNYLRLTHVNEWYFPPKLYGQELPDYWRPGFVPFAQNCMADRLAWALEWSNGGDIPVVFCPNSLNMARGYAPNFEGAVYRALIEELSGSWLGMGLGVQLPELKQLFARYIEMVEPVLPASWAKTLRRSLECEMWADEDGAHLIGDDRADEIIKSDLSFPQLGEQLRYTR